MHARILWIVSPTMREFIHLWAFVIRKKTLNERKEKEKENKEKKHISCAHAYVYIGVFHCPDRKSNIINGFRNYLFNIANDRTKTLCACCSCFEFDKVSHTSEICSRVTSIWLSIKMNEIVSHFRWLNAYCVYANVLIRLTTIKAKLVSSIAWIAFVLSFWMNL